MVNHTATSSLSYTDTIIIRASLYSSVIPTFCLSICVNVNTSTVVGTFCQGWADGVGIGIGIGGHFLDYVRSDRTLYEYKI